MECPHLEECVKLVEPACTTQNSESLWSCSVCQTEKSPWICLNCGEVNCGRYIQAHARDHHAKILNTEQIQSHSVCMDCDSTAIFCYQCDEFVMNDTPTGQLALIRHQLNILANAHHEDQVSVNEFHENLPDENEVHENGPIEIILENKLNENYLREKYSSENQQQEKEVTGSEHQLLEHQFSENKKQAMQVCENQVTGNYTEPSVSGLHEVQGNQPSVNQLHETQPSASHPRENQHQENCLLKESCKLKENCEQAAERSRRRKTSESSEGNIKKKVKTEEGTKVKPKTAGLRNLGNTCFMNAVLQSLSNIQSFCGYIKQLPSLETKVAKKKVHQTRQCKDLDDVPAIILKRRWFNHTKFVVEELRKTLLSLWQGSKGAISPEALFSVIWKVVPRFRGYQQQDAHEFMRYLLDRLHTELLTLLPYANAQSPFLGPKGKSTIVTAIFGGILQNEVNCLICGTESKKQDPFLDLSLDIPAHFTAKTAKPKDGELVCHISDCLSSFTEVEELEETELYYCYNCKQKQRSTKRFWIRRLPNVLCLHLKRFRWNTYFRCKVDTYVDFPLKGLDMNTFMLDNMHGTRNSCAGNNEYDLAAVIVHHGSGAGSGHYTAYAVHEGRWYHFNDSTVSACDEETVSKCKAYILFYVRRELRLPDSHNNLTKS